jgi:hypothetical protein
MRQASRWIALSILPIGLAAGVLATDLPPPSHAGIDSEAPSVDCETRLQTLPGPQFEDPRGRDFIAAGPVTFTAYFRDLSKHRLRSRRGQTKQLKAPIFVDAGPTTEIAILGRAGRRSQIRIGRDQGPGVGASKVLLAPCPPDATVGGRPVGPTTVFIGGWAIPGPLCMRVAVTVDGATEPIRKRLPFGKGSCRRSGRPSQRPAVAGRVTREGR